MKSRTLVHSNYESRILSARTQGSPLPSGTQTYRMTGQTPSQPAPEQPPTKSSSAAYQQEPLSAPRT